MQPRPGLLVGAAGADDHDPGRRRARPPAIGGDILDGGWRRGGQGVGFWGGDDRRRHPLRRDQRRRRPRRPHRVPLREGADRRRVAGDADAALPARPSPAPPAIDTDRLQRRPAHASATASPTSPATSAAPPQRTIRDRQQPAGPPALARRWPAARAGAGSTTSTSPGPIPTRASASPIGGAFWRITGPAGFDTGVKLAAGPRPRGARRPLRARRPAPTRSTSGCATRPATTRRRSAVEVPLRFDDVPPGRRLRRGRRAPAFPEPIRADAQRRALGPGRRGDPLPPPRRRALDRAADASFSPRRAAGQGDAASPASRSWLPAPTSSAPTPSTRAGNTASTTLRADGTEMAMRKAPPPVGADRRAVAPPRTQDAAVRAPARRPRPRRRADRPLRRAGRCSAAGSPAPTAPASPGRELRVVARPSRGALADDRRSTPSRTGERGGFELRPGAGPSRRITVAFPGDGGLERGPPRRRSTLRVRCGRRPRTRRRCRCGPARRCASAAGSATRGAPVPRRGKLVAIQYLEAATGRWRPVLVTRSDHGGRFRARYRFRYVSGAASIRLRATALAEERWPYAPGLLAPASTGARSAADR